jgi:hypothetical protein
VEVGDGLAHQCLSDGHWWYRWLSLFVNDLILEVGIATICSLFLLLIFVLFGNITEISGCLIDRWRLLIFVEGCQSLRLLEHHRGR